MTNYVSPLPEGVVGWRESRADPEGSGFNARTAEVVERYCGGALVPPAREVAAKERAADGEERSR